MTDSLMTGQDKASASRDGRREAFDAEDDAEAAWSLQDLRILHELRKPVAVVVSGVYEDPHRYGICCVIRRDTDALIVRKVSSHDGFAERRSPGGLQDYARALFQNRACRKEFGLPRLQAEAAEMYKAYPEDKKQGRRAWVLKCFQVNVPQAQAHTCRQ